MTSSQGIAIMSHRVDFEWKQQVIVNYAGDEKKNLWHTPV